MQAAKGATASVKEKVQNVKAKADMKAESNKASAVEKAERKTAEDKAGKYDAKAKKHAKEAEIHREYDQKRAEHASEKEQKMAILHQRHGDENAATAALVDENFDGHEQTTDFDGSSHTDASSHTPAPPPGRQNIADTNMTPGPPRAVPLPASENQRGPLHNTNDMGATPNTGSYL